MQNNVKRTSWTLTVEENYVLTFPDDLLETTGWQVGDTLEWIDLKDGSYELKKVDKSV